MDVLLQRVAKCSEQKIFFSLVARSNLISPIYEVKMSTISIIVASKTEQDKVYNRPLDIPSNEN